MALSINWTRFGAVLFEMVTGDRAFVRDQIVDTLHAILHDPPAFELEHRPGVPMSLAAIVGRLLQKAPAARFQSAFGLLSECDWERIGQVTSVGDASSGAAGQLAVSKRARW